MISKKKLKYMVMPVFIDISEQTCCADAKKTKFRHGQVRGLIQKHKNAEWFHVALYKYMTSNWMEIKRHADAHQMTEHMRARKFFTKFLRKRGIYPNIFFN